MWVKCWDVLGMAWPPRAHDKALERGSDSPLLLVCTGEKGKATLSHPPGMKCALWQSLSKDTGATTWTAVTRPTSGERCAKRRKHI